MQPKVFVSYSWSSPGHQARIRQWAEQLVSDGIEVVLDIWDLKEGDDKYAFMEKMVTDSSVTHVLVFSDGLYAEKADARKAGVGTESQIISNEVYSRVQQSKFIPIACQFDEVGEPFLPTFLISRIWIDFSSPEAANENWERLIRLLYGKPAHEKPTLGKPPTYVTVDVKIPANPATAKYAVLKQAVIQSKAGLKQYRRDFLETCWNYADELLVRERPEVSKIGERVVEDCSKLKHIRDSIVDWVLLESGVAPTAEFDEALISMLERLRELKSRSPGSHMWKDSWPEANRVFVYETFLYVVAALLKTESFRSLQLIFTDHYLLPESEANDYKRFDKFDGFYGYSESLQVLAADGRKLKSPTAELIRRHANRTDITFFDLMQAELVVLLMALVSEASRWYPQTFVYNDRGAAFPFFVKASRRRDFEKLAKITGIADVNELRLKVRNGQERLRVETWHDFFLVDCSFWKAMNMDNLDTLPS